MADFYCGLYFLGWLLLLACSRATDTPTPTSPQVVEVDLIFPRNETYAPIPLMPVVFAVQNFHAAKPLLLNFYYTLDHVPYTQPRPLIGLRHLQYANYTGSNTHFEYDWTSKLNNTEGTWIFTWEWRAMNCSQPDEAPPETHPGQGIPLEIDTAGMRNILYFTTKHGAKQPDLVAATQDNICAKSQAETANITEILDVPEYDDYHGTQTTCALLSTITPTPNPCGVKIDSSMASSISYAIQSTACVGGLSPNVTCPPSAETRNSAHRAVQFSAGGVVLLAATLAWLICIA
ncbi:hypothetical protein MGYG_02453 [Nannizzia gypsea CBS 118893]|uniref:DUF7136 domain-containing protein n=1 Tax=Arthroderma gypseum (strain ATCC MYA-4604 / CBS 118893) TaxID=535722 RepID=E4UMM4_ARTGP|nr:hypothetical protein MGYG_02453 [Nannizzia gypsea CBS 118893]EFQ99441.1 hypothetical protein MGYG_02453 [Nannizzia gypsea CBS 118893]